MGEYRTRAQREADKLDLDLFNLSRDLQKFAERFGDTSVDDASRIIYGLRVRVQKHMHADDAFKAAASSKASPHV